MNLRCRKAAPSPAGRPIVSARALLLVVICALGALSGVGQPAYAQDAPAKTSAPETKTPETKTPEKKAPEKKTPPAKSSAGQGPAGMSAEQVAERVQQFYKKTDDYHADFKQTYEDVAAGDKKISQGKVYFKKPGKMRWDYYTKGGKTRDKVLVSDGSSFWIYEYEFKQVFKKCLADSQLPTSLKFLMGQGDLLKEFNASFARNSSAERPVLDLIPKVPTAKYTRLVFALNPTTFQVRQTTIFDPYGNTNKIEFIDAQINKNLPDSGFDFKPPRDARLLNPQQKCD